jgi:branched-chain amino acid transport system ATP-binding protein
MNDSLQIRQVSKTYGGIVAVDEVNLTAPRGQVTSIVGPNGAGKSTLFSVVGGQQRLDSGEVIWDGRDLSRMSPEGRARRGIARTFQTSRPIPGFSVVDNVIVGAFQHERSNLLQDIFGGRRRRKEEARIREFALGCLARVGLSAFADDLPESLSYGMRRLVELARALASNPQMLLLDEPAAGLHTEEADQLGRLLVSLAHEDGVGVLLVEHNMRLVMGISQHVAVLNFGRMIAEGTPEAVSANELVLEVYLGRKDGSERGVDA